MSAAAPATRIVSLDQFRGYTVAGMFVVNFLGSYAAVPYVLKHRHDYCSYADTIMPHFLFAVGFAFRLTFERRVQREGAQAAYGRVIRRLLGLVLISMVIYAPGHAAETWDRLQEIGIGALARPLKREWFQTLMHIAVTSLWVLPVIRASAAVRIGFGVVSALAHVALSYWFNFAWVNADPNGIDGGPLGFLTWTIPTITGTLACDAMTTGAPPRLSRLCGWAVALMALGWLLSCGTRLYDVPADQVQSRRAQRLAGDPVVLLVAPLSGHHATLLRDTVRSLLADHQVYITDWVDARLVPLNQGPFTLADYVEYVREFMDHIGAERLHVISV